MIKQTLNKLLFAGRQLKYIEEYNFHPGIAEKVKKTYPHLNDDDLDLLFQGLRDYFYICHHAGNRMAAMPSQAVDVAWHEFILFTRLYTDFCQKALGKYLHHTPAEAMKTRTQVQEAIKRSWRIICHKEEINSRIPERLPLIFAMDAKLKISDGFHYTLNCLTSRNAASYCASHIGCGGGCAGSSGEDSGCESDSGGSFFGSGSGGDGGSCGGD